MAVIPPVVKVPSSTLIQYTPAKGVTLPTTNTSMSAQINPIPNPPMLLGVDFITKAFPSGVSRATFVNLPIRGTSNSTKTTQNQPQTLTINTGDYLIYKVTLAGQGAITPYVTDTSNVVYLNPGLSQGIYKTFQVQLTLTAPATLTVYGELYLYKGTQT